jgi:hypothetical protein
LGILRSPLGNKRNKGIEDIAQAEEENNKAGANNQDNAGQTVRLVLGGPADFLHLSPNLIQEAF